jgi:hypothetical protein
MGSQSTIPAPPGFEVPPSAGFVPDRLGVRRVSIDIDRDTSVIRASGTPCPATATAWGPVDAAEVTTADLVAELAALPTTGEIGEKRAAALAALPGITSGLVSVFAALLAGRE